MEKENLTFKYLLLKNKQEKIKSESWRNFFFKFILRDRERESESSQARASGGGAERFPSRFHAVSEEPNAGLELTNREIMTWLSHPGAPVFSFSTRPNAGLHRN